MEMPKRTEIKNPMTLTDKIKMKSSMETTSTPPGERIVIVIATLGMESRAPVTAQAKATTTAKRNRK